MVSIKWCLANKNGIKLIEPNANMSNSYLKMAEESIYVLNGVKNSRIWLATTTYYIFYYSLYSLMLRIGVKCEIHACSLEFMKKCLIEYYDETDMKMIEKAFLVRIDLQYYSDRPVDERVINETSKYCKDFYIKTKDIISKITETQIDSVRKKLK